MRNGKYIGSFINDSVITCDEIIQETETVQQILMKKGNLYNKKFYLPNFIYLFINYHSIVDIL